MSPMTWVDCARVTGTYLSEEEDLMSDALSFAEIDGQHVELLPARTVLSMVSTPAGPKGGDAGNGGPGGKGGPAGTGGVGGAGTGKAAIFGNWFYVEDGNVYNQATGGEGGVGGAADSSADGGAATGGAGASRG